MRIGVVALFAGLVLAVAACASSGPRTSVARGDRNTVTADELRQSVASNLYDFVQSTRPMWLRKRGQTSILMEGDIVVYLDDNRLGGPESLRTMSPVSVESMRFLEASAAQQRFGVGHSHGAILVYTRR